jgi:hypothetical protein
MLTRLWNASPPLTATGVLMIVVLGGTAAGLVLDPRIITGAPAWLKPAKFAISIAVYTFTLAWIFSLIPGWVRTRRLVGWTTAITMVLEMAIIAGQAFRGTTSHFNVSTPLDTVLFALMGLAIVAQTFSTIAVAVALWRQALPDRALGWALRFGMAITIAGALTGGLMTRPTPEQLEAARAGARMMVAGAHTVGAPDGGPGLPIAGWSTEHGDIRVAHFTGLHALQVLPAVALALGLLGIGDRTRVRLTLTAAASYGALFAILLAQALGGRPVLAPDAYGLALLGTWAVGTAAAAALSTMRSRPPADAHMSQNDRHRRAFTST